MNTPMNSERDGAGGCSGAAPCSASDQFADALTLWIGEQRFGTAKIKDLKLLPIVEALRLQVSPNTPSSATRQPGAENNQ